MHNFKFFMNGCSAFPAYLNAAYKTPLWGIVLSDPSRVE